MLVHVNDLSLKIAQAKYPRWSTSQNLLSLQHWFVDRNMRAEASLLLIFVEKLALERHEPRFDFAAFMISVACESTKH
jgi:hypothetical protein